MLIHRLVLKGISSTRVIEFAYLTDDQVLLVASRDGQFPYWIPKTAIQDIEINARILNQILFDDFIVFTRIWPELYKDMRHCYRRRIYITDRMIKETPFGYGLSDVPNQIKNWGKLIANSLDKHLQHTKERCKYREMEGKNLETLEGYLHILESESSTDAVRNYDDKLTLIELIESKDYLYLSENSTIINVYIQLRDITRNLYNQYMSEMK